MTALVGVFCKDGVVVGADSAATYATGSGQRTIEQPVMKIDIVDGKIIIAGTGQVGLGQRFCAVTKDLWANNKLGCPDELTFAKTLCAATRNDFASTGVNEGQYGALVAFPCKTKSDGRQAHLVEFAVTDLQPELKNRNMWYVSMGSGQTIIDPLLALFRDVFWSDGPPTVQDAIFATTWLLDHAVSVNPGGVNEPVRVAVLEKIKGDWAARMLSDDDLLEHRANVDAAKDSLRNYRRKMVDGIGAIEIPKPPSA